MDGTALVTICRCGWMAITPTFGDATEMFNEHKNEELDPYCSHDPHTVVGASNPLEEEVLRYFKRKASVLGEESFAIDQHKRWKAYATASNGSMGDVNHGLFLGFWNLLKIWGALAVFALCVYGLWRLR